MAASRSLISLAELQKFLIQRGVIVSGRKKHDLVELCQFAKEVSLEVDPDGLMEDRWEVIEAKLTDGEVRLSNPTLISGGADLSALPEFHYLDAISYLIKNQCSFGSVRDPQKSEGFSMMRDGFVKSIEVVCFDTPGYFAVKAQVRPRTREKDPVSGAAFYYPWAILTSVDSDKRSCVLSAYCTCKGGIDGCCRHVLATLYEVIDFRNDEHRESVTSGPCLWVRRATAPQVASQFTDIAISSRNDLTTPRPVEEVYKPVPVTMMPPVETILQDIKEHLPGSVFLHAWDEQPQEPPFTAPPLTVLTPLEWIEDFKQIHSCEGFGCQDQEDCAQRFLDRISWATEEQHVIEVQTRGQRKNKNWHSMRKGLLTASNIWKICRSTNEGKTAERLIENYGSEKEDARVPEAIKFGQDNEDRALTLFTRSHRYRHRQCSVRQPGLVVSTLEPYLAASPDAVVDCKHQNCGKFLVEVKCLYKHRNFHPKLAIKERDFAERGADGQLSVKQEHVYYYQMQCQMAVTGIHKCHLCVYTKKGIESIEVPFDPIFWDNISKRLSLFWKTHMFPKLLQIVNK